VNLASGNEFLRVIRRCGNQPKAATDPLDMLSRPPFVEGDHFWRWLGYCGLHLGKT
jgi:hypothetical protein